MKPNTDMRKESKHTFGSHCGWSQVGNRACTLHRGWRSPLRWAGGPGHTPPWWCSASPRNGRCQEDSLARSGPRGNNAGRQHMPCHSLLLYSSPGTVGDSTRPNPCKLDPRILVGMLEITHKHIHTNKKRISTQSGHDKEIPFLYSRL